MPSFVKIDTEGTELDVLRGMESTLTRDHPSFMIEIWDKNCKYPLRNIFEYMFNNDYATYWYHIKKKKIMYCRTVDQAVKDVSIDSLYSVSKLVILRSEKPTTGINKILNRLVLYL